MNRLPPRFGRPPENQSSMPSQQESVAVSGVPFNPVNQPDIRRPYNTNLEPDNIAGEGGASIPSQMADVRSIYDSRPVNGFDFYWEEQFNDGNRDTPAFVVPEGFVFVLRQIDIDIYANDGTSGTASRLNILGGDPNDSVGAGNVNIPKLQVHVDGVSTPLWTNVGGILDAGGNVVRGVPLWGFATTTKSLQMFVVIGSGSTFTIFIPIFTQTGSLFNTHVRYYGNMLLAHGIQKEFEIASNDPLPIIQGE